MSTTTETELSISELFHGCSNFALKKFISHIKLSTFKENYPKIYRKYPNLIKENIPSFSNQLQEQIKEDLDKLYTENNVSQKVVELASLTPKDEKAWRPSGNPNEDIRDHRYQVKQNHKKILAIILNKYQEQNKLALKKLNEHHIEILNLHKRNLQLEQQNDDDLESFISIFNSDLVPEKMDETHNFIDEE